MGWGADNPEPAAGQYNFAAFDARIALIRQTGGTPVITLCCAPDWMKGGAEGTTDWGQIEVAPSPEHFGDFPGWPGWWRSDTRTCSTTRCGAS